jgi:phosphoenolpyruvate carboxykinase (diphosphate)
MANGEYQGAGVEAPEIRAMFGREAMLTSDWYQERLRAKQDRDIALWRRHASALETFRATSGPIAGAPIDLEARITLANTQLTRVSSGCYLKELWGTLGADPLHGQIPTTS